MKYVTIDELSQIYQCAEKINVRRIRVPFEGLARFSRAIRYFERSLDEMAMQDDWQRFLRIVKRFRFDISAALMSQEQIEEKLAETIDSLSNQLRLLTIHYPELTKGGTELVDKLREVGTEPMAYLYDKFVLQYGRDPNCKKGSSAVIVKEARHIAPTSKAIHDYAGLSSWTVVNARELDNVLCFEHIVVIGAARWYPDYIFTAPRAEQIDILVYDFQSSEWAPKVTMLSPEVSSGNDQLKLLQTVVGNNEYQDDDTSDNDLGAGAAQRILGKGANIGDEQVSAQIVVLEGANAVFLDVSPNVNTLVIDLRTLSTDVVQKVPAAEIEPGMFVLLRTDVGGDFIVPLANKLMGEMRAKRLREMQIDWKNKLMKKVQSQGMEQVVIDLINYGSLTANSQNVRNWMSYRGIKTRNLADFKAIMAYLGMRSKSTEYWNAMVEIANAHRKAGFEISRLLKVEVEICDLTELRRMGIMQFELVEHEGSNMTAFRVLDILPGRYNVSPNRIGKPESIDELVH